MSRRLSALLIAASLTGSVAPWCAAQQCVPPAVVTSLSLSDADRAAIKSCVELHSPALTGTPAEISRARKLLAEPLREPAASVPFRLEMSRLLMPSLRKTAADSREEVAINSLLLAGFTATSESSNLLADSLKDARPAVRYAAAAGLERVFAALGTQSPALTAEQAISLLNRTGVALSVEQDPSTLDGIVLAFETATRISDRKMAGVRAAAVLELGSKMGKRAHDAKAGDGIDDSLRRSGEVVRNALIDRQSGALPQEALVQAAGLAGQLLTYVRGRIQDGGLDESARTQLAVIAAVAEKAYFFAAAELFAVAGQQSTATDQNLKDMIERDKDDDFVAAVDRVIGAQGILTAAPFNFPDNTFITP